MKNIVILQLILSICVTKTLANDDSDNLILANQVFKYCQTSTDDGIPNSKLNSEEFSELFIRKDEKKTDNCPRFLILKEINIMANNETSIYSEEVPLDSITFAEESGIVTCNYDVGWVDLFYCELL